MKSNRAKLTLIISAFLLCFSAFAAGEGSEFYPAAVKDISDRSYEPAVIHLLDNAKESIVMSMYMVKSVESEPVSLLLKDLEEALGRGVGVEIYINTHPIINARSIDITSQPFQSLVNKGAKIYKLTPSIRLHDKLIIVDARYIVDGSMNWGVSAIKSNFESAVLIDSPELARVKLTRLRNFPLEGQEKKPDRPKAFEPLPKGAIVEVKEELLNNKRYLPAIHGASADHDMITYLLLLAESTRIDETEFSVSLEDLAVSVGCRPNWTDTQMRQQATKDLKMLANRYKLIDVSFSHSKDASVKVRELPGKTFKVSGDFFDPKNLTKLSLSAKFIYLTKVLLESEGTPIESIKISDLSRRFGISRSSIRIGLEEIGARSNKS